MCERSKVRLSPSQSDHLTRIYNLIGIKLGYSCSVCICFTHKTDRPSHAQGDKLKQIVLTLTVPVTTIDALNTLKQDNDSTVRGDGESRVGEVRAGTTSPMPEHKGFMLQ